MPRLMNVLICLPPRATSPALAFVLQPLSCPPRNDFLSQFGVWWRIAPNAVPPPLHVSRPFAPLGATTVTTALRDPLSNAAAQCPYIKTVNTFLCLPERSHIALSLLEATGRIVGSILERS
ncbi:unnamed protein product [Toxocara canis]|uniref:Secreted protein n=1 Tax=Toxocara canis TaxID=6265 RepID=A0A183U6C5_TOXCA|nr:unnamed protein product [Toxocara canis]